jgi:hypothetical protein
MNTNGGDVMLKVLEKLRWWRDSVKGLLFHLEVHRVILRRVLAEPVGSLERGAWVQLLCEQEGMIGHQLLLVLLRYPIGSGRFL